MDIETRPGKGYYWSMFKEDMNIQRVIEPGRVLCIGAKWLGSPKTFFFSEWEHGQKGMAEGIAELLLEADAVIHYNGNKFDMPKIRGFMLLNGLDDIPPVTSIDLYKEVRKLGFDSNKLAFIAPLLGIGQKVSHAGFDLWVRVMEGHKTAQRQMERYCVGDVKLTEKLYLKVKGFILNHPHLGKDSHECGSCGSKHLTKRGYRRTKYFITERLKCKRCGSWSMGKRKKIT